MDSDARIKSNCACFTGLTAVGSGAAAAATGGAAATVVAMSACFARIPAVVALAARAA